MPGAEIRKRLLNLLHFSPALLLSCGHALAAFGTHGSSPFAPGRSGTSDKQGFYLLQTLDLGVYLVND